MRNNIPTHFELESLNSVRTFFFSQLEKWKLAGVRCQVNNQSASSLQAFLIMWYLSMLIGLCMLLWTASKHKNMRTDKITILFDKMLNISSCGELLGKILKNSRNCSNRNACRRNHLYIHISDWFRCIPASSLVTKSHKW